MKRRHQSGLRVRTTPGTYIAEVVEEDMHALTLNTIVLHDDARAANYLARVALTVDLAETSPSAQNLTIPDFDKVNLVLSAKSLNEFNVLRFRAGLNKNAKVGLAFVESLGTLTKATRKTVVNKCVLQDLLMVNAS